MEEFVDKLINQSDQWITKNAINDKQVFKAALEKVFSDLPSPLNQTLSNNAKIINSLWMKIQQKYDESSKNKYQCFFSNIDIDEYLNDNKDDLNKQKALRSNKATLKHYTDSNLNPFFKSYNNISYQNVNNLLDILLKNNNKCNDEWLSLIQYRFNQLLSNKNNSKKVSKKNIRLLSQKLYRLFCHHVGNKCINTKNKQSVGLLFNQILIICKDDVFCTDICMNILSFIRVFLEYSKESISSFEYIQKCIDIKILITKLFELIMNRYNSMNHWSNTQQLIFLWSIYECHQNDYINNKYLLKLLKWTESMWSFNGLVTIFSNKSIESFADFTNAIYQHNMLSVFHDIDDDDDDDDDDDNDDNDFDDDDTEQFIGDEFDDIMNIDHDNIIIDNINDIKDEDLFTLDIDINNNNNNNNNNNKKRPRDEDNDDNSSSDDIDEPPTKKQRENDK